MSSASEVTSCQPDHDSVLCSSTSSQPLAICVRVLEFAGMGFYIIEDDILKKKKNKATATIAAPLATLKLGDESCIVVNGHLLYNIGGCDGGLEVEWSPSDNKSTVYEFDIRPHSAAAPTQLPSMIAPGRRSCAGLVHSQRLYVFGGIDLMWIPQADGRKRSVFEMPAPADYPWAEVLNLDEKDSGWKRLKEPPVRFPAHFGTFALLLNDTQILVGTLQKNPFPDKYNDKNNTFYIYHIDIDDWSETNHKDPPVGVMKKPPFLVDNDDDDQCLYWLHGGSTLSAYSLKTYENYSGNLPFLSDYATRLWDGTVCHEPALLHLGGREFCVILEDLDNNGDKDSVKFWCFRFEAKKKSKGGNLDISQSCPRASFVIQKCVQLCDACLLDFGAMTIQGSSSQSSLCSLSSGFGAMTIQGQSSSKHSRIMHLAAVNSKIKRRAVERALMRKGKGKQIIR